MLRDWTRFRVEPGTEVDLADWDANDRSAFEGGGKRAGHKVVAALRKQLAELQELLYAENRRKILVVLQAMDTGGKDGVIRRVFGAVNPQGVKVTNFKVPTPIELAHDYLWRVHPRTPARGEISLFNRSHYEDVLIVRVRNLVPPEVWQRRYEHINAFEKLLVDEGATILKFYLHISKDEQKARLQSRLDDPHKHWKFNVGDLAERARWDEYMEAYTAVLNKTSTPWAPWFIIPANRKWYRDVIIASVMVDTLTGFDMQYPVPKEDLSQVVVE